MCKICGNDACIGKYLLHSAELGKIPAIKNKELKESPDRTFKLVDSPSSGEIFTKFYEIHVIDEIGTAMAKAYDDFLFECFEPFGITRDNITEFKDRIIVVEHPDSKSTVRLFHLDGVYIFGVTIQDHGLEIAGSVFRKTTTFRKNID